MEKIPTNSGDKKDNNEKRFKEALNDFLAGDIERTAQYLKENPEQISKFCHRAAYGYMGVIEAGLQGLMIFCRSPCAIRQRKSTRRYKRFCGQAYSHGCRRCIGIL